MTGTKTNERPGVRAHLRGARFSAYKAREVLDLIRNLPVGEARAILALTERACSEPILKLLDSAIANAGNNNDIPPEELFVASCYADEGPTLKRFRPRARGRASRIRKRTCNVTIIVGRLSGADLERMRERVSRGGRPADAATSRARRVARSRARQQAEETEAQPVDAEIEEPTAEAEAATEAVEETVDSLEAQADEAVETEEVADEGDEVAAEAEDDAVEADDEDEKDGDA
jgi:large subunit ribosomal protein L22